MRKIEIRVLMLSQKKKNTGFFSFIKFGGYGMIKCLFFLHFIKVINEIKKYIFKIVDK